MAKRITRYMLRNCGLLTSHFKRCIKPKKFTTSAPASFSLLLSQFSLPFVHNIYCLPKINVEDDLRTACNDGETAIIDLMNELQNLVIETSKEYRNLLQKQIEITQRAIIVGPVAFDELPQYRSLADELFTELNEYWILLKTIGQIAYDQSLISAVVNGDLNEKNLNFIVRKYQELEVILLREFEENKRKELELLENKLASIEHNKMCFA